MSTVPTGEAFTTDERLANLLFDYPGADIVLRSQDSCHFRMPKIYIVNSSPVLGELIRKTLDSPGTSAKAEISLPVIELPESGEILHCLLTFIFPITPIVPSTPAEIMKLLSVAQEYKMGTVLIHIRGSIARQNPRQNPPPTRLESALHIYALAQKYGLRPEALQAARAISNYSMAIDDFNDKFDIMPGASLYELWKYHENVQAILASDLTEFRTSGARGTMTGLRCEEYNSSQIPNWVDQYIESIEKALNLFDLVEFNTAMARHISPFENEFKDICECASISSQTIREFWASLESVVNGSFEKASLFKYIELFRILYLLQAESALVLVREREDQKSQSKSTALPLEPFNIPDANLIVRSSDGVDFRVHKLVLAVSSPFFKDLLSLPQPSDGESVDGLPVVQFPEDSELLNSLFSMVYPLRPVIPKSYDQVLYMLGRLTVRSNVYYKVLYLLAACQKYEMASVQSIIRGKVSYGEFPAPKGTAAFAAYAIASSKGLIPEMEKAARQTLDHPMTFETLGKGLRLFEGWALRDLVSFRTRCKDNLTACFDSYSSPWVGCRNGWSRPLGRVTVLPKWLNQFLLQSRDDLKLQVFTHPLDVHSRIRREYLKALQAHLDCKTCLVAHATHGLTFCAELERKLALALDKVTLFLSLSTTMRFTSRRHVVTVAFISD